MIEYEKFEIFLALNDYAKYDNLTTGIDRIKQAYNLNDIQFLPIYNEWLLK